MPEKSRNLGLELLLPGSRAGAKRTNRKSRRFRPRASSAPGPTRNNKEQRANMAANRTLHDRRFLEEVAGMMKQIQPGGALAPFEDRRQWERLLESSPVETRELLAELARFADLW